VSSEQARAVRNPNEKAAQHFQWQALAAALDPLDFSGKMHSAHIKFLVVSDTKWQVASLQTSHLCIYFCFFFV
jgi:hypothetical protein